MEPRSGLRRRRRPLITAGMNQAHPGRLLAIAIAFAGLFFGPVMRGADVPVLTQITRFTPAEISAGAQVRYALTFSARPESASITITDAAGSFYRSSMLATGPSVTFTLTTDSGWLNGLHPIVAIS